MNRLQWLVKQDSLTTEQLAELLLLSIDRWTPEEKTAARRAMRESPLVLTHDDRAFLRQVGVDP